MRITPRLSVVALAASLLLGGCVNPDGSPDVGGSLLLGVATAALIGVAVSDGGHDHRGWNDHRGSYRDDRGGRRRVEQARYERGDGHHRDDRDHGRSW